MIPKSLTRFLPSSFKCFVKEGMLRLCNVPWSRIGIPPPLVSALRGHKNIVLVDVGASDGETASLFHRFCGLRQALFIEPQPARCEQLRRTFPPPNYKVVCSA